MKLIIDESIFARFPGLSIGVVVAHGADNSLGEIAEVGEQIRQEEALIRGQFTVESLATEPKIAAWREAYVRFGAKPKDHLSSVENLYRLVLRNVNLRHVNNLVDIYNLVSLRYMLPVGGEDIATISGDLWLRFARDNESSALLLGDNEPRVPHAGEVIYADDISAVCRRWNWREADRTKLTVQTKHCVLVIESLPPATQADVEKATQTLSNLVREFCGGQMRYAILDGNTRELNLD